MREGMKDVYGTSKGGIPHVRACRLQWVWPLLEQLARASVRLLGV